jgi:uncharacterized protein
LKSFISLFLDQLDKGAGYTNNIDIIFFGGEPTLNIAPINHTIDTLNDFLRNKANGMIQFNYDISTNGVWNDMEVLNMFSRYNMNIGLSLDGPREIHDYHRIKYDGTPSYDDVILSLEDLLHLYSKGKINLTIESVITKYTLSRMSLIDLAEYFMNSYGVNQLSFYPVTTVNRTQYLEPPFEMKIRFWKEFFDYLIENASEQGNFTIVEFRTLNLLLKIILTLSKKISPYYKLCNAGKDVVALNYDGNIYVCGTSIGDDRFRLGHIREIYNFEQIVDLAEKLFINNYSEFIGKCLGCDVSIYCGGICPVANMSRKKRYRCSNNILGKYMMDKLTQLIKNDTYFENIRKAIVDLRKYI